MKFLDSFYKTKNLSNNGKFIAIVCIVLLIFGKVLIPNVSTLSETKQIFTLNGKNIKYNDSPEVSQFFKSIQQNNGFLCLGTSESGSIDGGNYYNFLNSDPDIQNSKFSILAGAGRTCGLYIPLFLQHKKELNNIKLIYFINPVYWGNNLCDVSPHYWERYSNYRMTKYAHFDSINSEIFAPVNDYYKSLNLFVKSRLSIEYFLHNHRRAYFHDLKYVVNPETYSDQFTFISNSYRDLSLDSVGINKPNINELDTVFNISKSFTHKDWFSQVNTESDYRYRELKGFIKLCKHLNISATFILGPINKRFILSYASSDMAAYNTVIENVRKMLQDEKVDFIDATDISSTIGAFKDHQHHSSYGGYLIYQKIKAHFYEK